MWQMKWFLLAVLIISTTGKCPKVCESRECLELGSRMRSMMNTQVDPCDDFYEFSCGNFEQVSISRDESSSHSLDDWVDLSNFFKYYKPIHRSERIALEFLKKCEDTQSYGDVDYGVWEDEKNDLTDILIEMAKVDTLQPGLITNLVFQDEKNLVLYIRSGLDKDTDLDLISDHIMKYNKHLAVENTTYLNDIEENEFEFLNLTKYAIGLLPEKFKHNFQNWTIVVYRNEIKLVDTLIKAVGPEFLKQKLLEKWIDTLTSYLVSGKRHRYDKCFEKTEKLFPGTLGMIFVRQFVKTENLEKSQELFENLREVFEEMLNENTWLDEQMKETLKMELKDMESSIGISDDHKNPEEMDKIYERVEENQSAENQTYLQLVHNLLKMNSEETFLRVSRKDNIKLATRPMKFNANFGITSHRVSAAAILLNYPYIDKKLPEWNTISSIGYIIGHEIGHAFDANNFYSYKQVYKYRMTSETKNEFDKRIDCLTQKYDKFEFPDGSKSNGTLTSGEDSADLIGFNLSWRLFEKMLKSRNNLKLPGFEKFSLKQQFFQRMAYVWCAAPMKKNDVARLKNDVHSAAKFRINGMMSNSEHFAKAYQCEKNSPMNPVKKCPLFK